MSPLLLVSLTVLLSLAGILGTGSPSASARTAPAATVTLTEISPTSPRPGQMLVVAGYVRNTGPSPLDEVSVSLLLSSRPVGSRSQLASLAANGEQAWAELAAPPSPAATPVPVAASLTPGQRRGFRVVVDTNGLGLGRFGVYPMVVAATSTQGRVGVARTFLPWSQTASTYAPTSLVWLWPLVTAPRRDATGASVGPPVSAQLRPTDRLGRLAAETGGAQVTWVVDPDLLDAANTEAAAATGQAPSSPPEPALPDGSATSAAPPDTPAPPGTAPPADTPAPPGTPAPPADTTGTAGTPGTADSWLRALRRATLGQPVVGLPYADPDLTAVHRAGLDADVRAALVAGRRTVVDVLGRTATDDVAWPAAGMLDASTANSLTKLGFTSVVLDPATLPAASPTTYTPTGRVDVITPAGRLRGAVADPTLSALASAPLTSPDDVTTQVQRFLAETAMITAERPSQSRSVLVAPPREWSPDPGLPAALLTALTQADWVRLTGLETMLDTPADRQLRAGDLVYPPRARSHELAGDQLRRVAAAETAAVELSTALARPDELLTGVRLAAARLTSVHWRSQPATAARLTDRLVDHVATLRAGLHVQAGPVVLGARTGTFPVTVVNDLDQPVTVRIELRPDTARIRLPGAKTVAVGAQRREQVNIPVEAVANGDVVVTAQLTTPTGQTLGEPVRVPVRVTQIGVVGLVITVGAAAVLFIAAGVRVGRRTRTRRS